MVRHNAMQFFSATEYILAMVTVGIKLTMSITVWPDNPNVCVATDDYNISVNNGRDVNVGWHLLVSLLHDNGRRGRWRSQSTRENFVYLVRVDNKLALLVRRTSCQEGRTYNYYQQSVCNWSQVFPGGVWLFCLSTAY
jgi:hypothetical protein